MHSYNLDKRLIRKSVKYNDFSFQHKVSSNLTKRSGAEQMFEIQNLAIHVENYVYLPIKNTGLHVCC